MMKNLLVGFTFLLYLYIPGISQTDSTIGESSQEPVYSGRYRTPADSLIVAEYSQKVSLYYQTKIDSALYAADSALQTARKSISGGDHPDLTTCTSNMGYLLDAIGRTLEAETLYVESLAMRRRMYPFDHPELANSINNMAYFHFNQGKIMEAEKLFLEALAMKRRMYKDENRELAIGINNLGMFYDYTGEFEKAEEMYIEAFEMYKRLFKGDDPDLAVIIGNLAHFYTNTGKYKKAEPLYREALEMYRRMYVDDHPDLALSMNNAAYYFELVGKISEAEKLYREALQMYRRLFREDHPDLATSINNMASFYQSRGLDAEAEQLYMEALAMRRRLFPQDHPDLAASINNIAFLYMNRGRYSEAEPLFLETYEMLKRLFKSDHPRIALSMNNLAALYDLSNDPKRAETFYIKALEMKRRLYQNDHEDLARGMNNLGSFYEAQMMYVEAESLIREALGIYRRIFESDTPELAVCIGNLAKILAQAGKYSEADTLFRESHEMHRRIFDIGHRELMTNDRHYANFLADQGRFDEALPVFTELIMGVETAMKQSFGIDSENHQLSFISNVLRPNVDAYARFCVRYHEERNDIAGAFLDALLRFKGAVANESARRQAEFSKNIHAIELNKRLTILREQDANLASRPQDPGLREQRAEIQKKADSLDAALRKLDREYDKLKRRQNVSWKDVQRELKPDEALVEYAVLPYGERSGNRLDTMLYVAIILRKTSNPSIVRLCPENQLEKYLANEIRSGDKTSYVFNPIKAHELYNLVFQPMEQFLIGIKRVYLATDGVLHRLSFDALVREYTQERAGYLEDAYDIHYLTGGRELLSRNIIFNPTPYREPMNFALMGNPAFSIDDGSQKTGDKSSRGEKKNKTRAQDEYPYARGGIWEALPGTEKEVREIASLCKSKGVPCSFFLGEDATEGRVKKLSGNSPLVFHIATHGFFFPVRRFVDLEKERIHLLRGGARQLRIEDNPMLRSGLLFTGVNRVWTGMAPIEGVDDGILSALEISRLDFTGTELVTLSACQTGLGDITNGEGIFGLQRAFQVAGARTILMSLWKIADEPTAELMNNFYKHWLGGKTKTEALRTAKEDLRNRYPEPYFWAAFVLIGE